MPPGLYLVIVLLGCGLLLVLGSAALMARMMLRPPRMTDGKAAYVLSRVSPDDLGLAFKSISLTVRDMRTGTPLELAAWWLPSPTPSRRTVLLLHGYADAKIGAIAWAPMLLEMGLNVAAVDLRAHGESGGSMTTGGFFERHDVDQAIDQIKSRFPNEITDFYLYGVSLGSAVAIAAAALREDVAGVIMDSAFLDYRSAFATQASLTGAPGGVVARLAGRFAAWRAGADFKSIRPVDLVRRSACPVLVFLGTCDPFSSPQVVAAYSEAIAQAPAGSRLVVLEGIGHLAGLRDATGVYVDAVHSFLLPQSIGGHLGSEKFDEDAARRL
jgi:pimeloyl-ACP methyl ester carboxylesterase